MGRHPDPHRRIASGAGRAVSGLEAGDAGDGVCGDQAMTGTLYGIGVGPGDPELLTLKAVRILNSVPVIAWPAPLQGEGLARSIAAPHLPGCPMEIAIRIPIAAASFQRSEARRGGKEWVSTGRSRWCPVH